MASQCLEIMHVRPFLIISSFCQKNPYFIIKYKLNFFKNYDAIHSNFSHKSYLFLYTYPNMSKVIHLHFTHDGQIFLKYTYTFTHLIYQKPYTHTTLKYYTQYYHLTSPTLPYQVAVVIPGGYVSSIGLLISVW